MIFSVKISKIAPLAAGRIEIYKRKDVTKKPVLIREPAFLRTDNLLGHW